MTGDQTDTSFDRKTASEAGLSLKEQILIILSTIADSGGIAQIEKIYSAVEEHMDGAKLSKQGKASLRERVNRYSVRRGYVFPHDPKNPGWRITDEGRRLVEKGKLDRMEPARKASSPRGPIIHVEEEELIDEKFEEAVRDNRIRIGIVPTNTETSIARQRRGQDQIRKLTLANYDSMCAFCDVSDPSLLVAGHIVGWAELPDARGILSNIICFCKFHDALFEHGYLSLSDDLAVLKKANIISRTVMLLLDNTVKFRKPCAHPPDPRFLQWHRNRFGL